MKLATTKQTVKATIDWMASLAMIAVAVWLIMHSGPAPARSAARAPASTPFIPATPLSISESARIGSANAKVALIAYSDFECPYCQQFATQVWPDFNKRYIVTGKVIFVFRHLPLVIHSRARTAAIAAACADRQGKFVQMHDGLFASPNELAMPAARKRADQLGLNLAQFDECIVGPGATLVDRETREAEAARVTGTPTFFIGDVSGNLSVKLVERIDGSTTLDRLASVLKKRYGI